MANELEITIRARESAPASRHSGQRPVKWSILRPRRVARHAIQPALATPALLHRPRYF
jgi:hypothetical protein